ncbi:tyrosinase co-factor protein [Streptomyces solincola]|uniref:Tyrosinase co-factor protein n=1 Tax=Streptomyces solincola TaxID=2100817 RepID=A0A2S9PQY0_9ACTN|nr:tyrosinase family oxidase copper chaperone [Streptomyces solincola]PRH76828.1 tyrosinase co-factor protein [Streptomyces solincola]
MIRVRGPGRRAALRTLFTLAVAAFTGGALAPLVRHADGTAGRESTGRGTGPRSGFDEMYRGHRIQGGDAGGGAPGVYVDGRPLHLMRCADGGFLSPLDHYASYPTPLAAARAAVDELGAARLSARAAVHGGGRAGGHQRGDGRTGGAGGGVRA